MWISVLERVPPTGHRVAGGLSDVVLVSVECDNGVKFVSTDRYDKHTSSWEACNPLDALTSLRHITMKLNSERSESIGATG